MDLVDDHAFDAAKRITREAREDQIKRLGCRNENVRGLALVARALARRRVAGSDCDGRLAVRDPEALRLPSDPDERLAEVPFDVDRKCFEGRDVHHSRRWLLRSRREHEMVDRGKECCERFPGSGGCEYEDAVSGRDRGPAELLRARWCLECRLEPRTRRGIERRERITPHETMLNAGTEFRRGPL